MPPVWVAHWIWYLRLHPIKVDVDKIFPEIVLHILHSGLQVVSHGVLGANPHLVDLKYGLRLFNPGGVEGFGVAS